MINPSPFSRGSCYGIPQLGRSYSQLELPPPEAPGKVEQLQEQESPLQPPAVQLPPVQIPAVQLPAVQPPAVFLCVVQQSFQVAAPSVVGLQIRRTRVAVLVVQVEAVVEQSLLLACA